MVTAGIDQFGKGHGHSNGLNTNEWMITILLPECMLHNGHYCGLNGAFE